MSSKSSSKSADSAFEHRKLSAELQFLGQMASTETALFHQQAAAKNGLSITDSKTISVLMQEGPMTAGQLAQRLSLTTGAVTSVIDRLEAAGAVRRTADPTDRRKVIVQVLPKALAKGAQTYESIGQNFQKILDTYTTEQLKFLVDYYRASIELTKQEIRKLSDSK